MGVKKWCSIISQMEGKRCAMLILQVLKILLPILILSELRFKYASKMGWFLGGVIWWRGAGEGEQEAIQRPSCAWCTLLLSHLLTFCLVRAKPAQARDGNGGTTVCEEFQGAELPGMSPVPLSKSFQFSEPLFSPAKWEVWTGQHLTLLY